MQIQKVLANIARMSCLAAILVLSTSCNGGGGGTAAVSSGGGESTKATLSGTVTTSSSSSGGVFKAGALGKLLGAASDTTAVAEADVLIYDMDSTATTTAAATPSRYRCRRAP